MTKKSFAISLILLMTWFSLGPAPAVIQAATQKLGHCRQKLCYCQSPHHKSAATQKKMFCHLNHQAHEMPAVVASNHKVQLKSGHEAHRKTAMDSGDISYLTNGRSESFQEKLRLEILSLKNVTSYSFLFDLSFEKPPQFTTSFFIF